MAIATTTALVAGGLAIAGAAGGAAAKSKTNTNQSVSGIKLDPASALENQATNSVSSNFGTLQDYANAGPGLNDITAGAGAQRDLAALLQQYQASGGAPGAQFQSSANNYAAQMFAGQRVQADQNALQAQQQYAQQAAIQGRGGLDAVFRNKQATEQANTNQLISANQGAFAAQQAQQFSNQSLGYAQQRASVMGGLASQALSNRQALVGLGSQLQAQQQNFRLQTGERYGTQTQTETTPGSVMGAITGGLGGAAAGVTGAGGFAQLLGPAAKELGIGGGAKLAQQGRSMMNIFNPQDQA